VADLTRKLPAAIVGNGSLLASISARGRVEQIWAPHPDRATADSPLAGDVEVDARGWTQSYVGATQMLRTLAHTDSGDVVIDHVVHDAKPVLLRRMTWPDGRTETLSAPDDVDESFDAVVTRRASVDAAMIGSAEPPLRERATPLYERSLLVFDALADRETGAVVAAPECDAEQAHSGGYGFVWPRDLAFLILAFLASGRHDLARGALRWLARAQEPDGVWLQRHWTDGSVAPSWCPHQLDETAAVVFAYDAAWRHLGDETLDAELWPSARRAAEFLLRSVDVDGLPRETYDLWEERQGCHAYTAASFVGAFRAASSLAQRHEPELSSVYATAAERTAAALERAFWSEEHACYLRTLGDPTVDASLLGLAWPFRAVDPRSDRMRATALAVERDLGRPGGGILRYAGDTYAGGNAWILAALWLGLVKRQLGDDAGHDGAVDYAARVATPLGLLAEQVTDDGRPAWVLPLAWSHAMLVLAVRPELDLATVAHAVAAPPQRVAHP
jgi:glucoamylase